MSETETKGELLFDFQRQETHIQVWQDDDSEKPFILYWNDYVVNDWEERYTTLAITMLRVACLLECEASEWSKFFNTNAYQFQQYGEGFIKEHVQ